MGGTSFIAIYKRKCISYEKRGMVHPWIEPANHQYEELNSLNENNCRYGYPRITDLLQPKGWKVNWKVSCKNPEKGRP